MIPAVFNGPLFGKDDGMRSLVFIAAMLASVVVALVLPSLADVSYFESMAAISVPFLALGILDLLLGRNWIYLAVTAAVSVLAYFADWRFSVVALMFLAGSQGIAGVTDLLQRLLFLRMVSAVEDSGTSATRTVLDRAVSFVFGIPEGMDARNIRVNRTIQRDRMPWKDLAEGMLPAFLLMMFLWMFASSSFGFRSDVGDNYLLSLSVTMYIVAFASFWFVFRAVDVRVEWGGMCFRLHDGFMGTVRRMIVPAFVGLVVIIIGADPGWNALWLMIISGVFCAVMVLLSQIAFTLTEEQDFVGDMSARWVDDHPLDFYSGYDGRDGRHPLDDGVPGTPRRPDDSCFPSQKY